MVRRLSHDMRPEDDVESERRELRREFEHRPRREGTVHVLDAERQGRLGISAVIDRDVVAAVRQLRNDVLPDEARSADDEDPHRRGYYSRR
jgi:hypothetical protein